MLWTAIAHIQWTEPSIVSVVYNGDTDASKEEIIAEVEVRAFDSVREALSSSYT